MQCDCCGSDDWDEEQLLRGAFGYDRLCPLCNWLKKGKPGRQPEPQ